MTEKEKFYFIINQNNVRKEMISSKRTQTIEYWVNAYRIACKVKLYNRNKVTDTQTFIYYETLKQAQEMNLLPAFPS